MQGGPPSFQSMGRPPPPGLAPPPGESLGQPLLNKLGSKSFYSDHHEHFLGWDCTYCQVALQ